MWGEVCRNGHHYAKKSDKTMSDKTIVMYVECGSVSLATVIVGKELVCKAHSKFRNTTH